MKILSEKQQIIDRITSLDETITHQHKRFDKALKRVSRKLNWAFPFFVFSDMDNLKFTRDCEKDNLISLKEYRASLVTSLNNTLLK